MGAMISSLFFLLVAGAAAFVIWSSLSQRKAYLCELFAHLRQSDIMIEGQQLTDGRPCLDRTARSKHSVSLAQTARFSKPHLAVACA